MKKLKPCPFCGGETLTVCKDFMILCEQCKTVFIQQQNKNPNSMLKVWERRENNDN